MLNEQLDKLFDDERERLLGKMPAVCSFTLMIEMVTSMFLALLDQNRDKWTHEKLGEDLFMQTMYFIARYNKLQKRRSGLFKYTALLPIQIARLVSFIYCIRRIPCAGERGNIDLDILAIYQELGPSEGIYSENETALRWAVRTIKPDISNSDFSEVRQALRDIVPRVERTQERDLVPVNNGIFNYRTKELLNFSPEYIFLSKSCVNYNENAQNIVIHNPDDGTTWDVESWMASLSDDPAIVALLWQVLGAVIRPFVRWGKCVMFYATSGNNGKGTLCELMRSLCGEGRYASIPVENFGENFLLEKLPEVMAVIVDENNVGSYLDKAGNFKAVVTNDVIQINRKNKAAIPYQFFGLVVQAFNELPRIKDKSESIYRRCLFIPFDKCFTGAEKKYIKSDYLHRPEVLEYVLYKVLNTDYYEFSEPAACRNVLADYKVYNDPVRQWWDEVSDKFAWDLLPWEFLYEIYKQWCKSNNPSGKTTSKRGFVDQMREVAERDAIWECPCIVDKDGRRKDKQISSAGRIVSNEPLGFNAGYRLGDANYWRGVYRGLLRRVPTTRPQPQLQPQSQTQPQTQTSNRQDYALTISYEEAVSATESSTECIPAK